MHIKYKYTDKVFSHFCRQKIAKRRFFYALYDYCKLYVVRLCNLKFKIRKITCITTTGILIVLFVNCLLTFVWYGKPSVFERTLGLISRVRYDTVR